LPDLLEFLAHLILASAYLAFWWRWLWL